MSSFSASIPYDGDAVSDSAVNTAPSRRLKQVTDTATELTLSGGEFEDDTTVALTGNTARTGKKLTMGKRVL